MGNPFDWAAPSPAIQSEREAVLTANEGRCAAVPREAGSIESRTEDVVISAFLSRRSSGAHLPEGTRPTDIDAHLQHLLDEYCRTLGTMRPVLWYYTPLMRRFLQHLSAAAIGYGCMDELANFDFAPAGCFKKRKS